MNEDDAFELLRKYNVPYSVVRHSVAVKNLVLKILERVKIPVNKDIVILGALLHDIGRAKTNDIRHGYIGAEILRKEGVPEEVAKIAERHVGSGITKEEAYKFGMPERDYIPESPEEKIVAYADNLIDDTKEISEKEFLNKMKKKFGTSASAYILSVKLIQEIKKMMR